MPYKRLFCILIFLLSFIGMLSLSPVHFGTRAWQAFDIVLLPAGDDFLTGRKQLAAAGMQFIDRLNATVEVETFGTYEELSIADIASRFDTADPRIDPFLKRLPHMFRAEKRGMSHEVLFLVKRPSIPRRFYELKTVFQKTPFYLMGWQPYIPIFSLCGSLLVMLIAMQRIYVGKRWKILCILFVVSYSCIHGLNGFICSTVVGLCWAIWLQLSLDNKQEGKIYTQRISEKEKHAMIIFLFSIAAAVVFLWVSRVELRLIISFMLFLIGLVHMSALVKLLSVQKLQNRDHRLFLCTPILQKKQFAHSERRFLFSMGIIAACVMAIIAAERITVVDVPAPQHIAHAVHDDFAAVLDSASHTGENLSTAGYFAHRQYQQALLYGRAYQMPVLNEKVFITRFRRNNGVILSYQEVVLRFDEEWFQKQISEYKGTAYQIFIQEAGVFFVAQNRYFGDWQQHTALLFLLVIAPVLFCIIVSCCFQHNTAKVFSFALKRKQVHV